MKNNHKRNNYEIVYNHLLKEAKIKDSDINSLSDFQLLSKINRILILMDCIPFTIDELEIELI